MNIILNLLGSPRIGQTGINLLKTFFAWILLGLSMFFPIAGWHRLYLNIPGWHWWPVFGFLAMFGALTMFIVHTQQWLLMALPLSALFAHDCILILKTVWERK